ncbi:MAG TPA: hypothetical protein VF024_20395 [Solirubrobacteraceae bacterium]
MPDVVKIPIHVLARAARVVAEGRMLGLLGAELGARGRRDRGQVVDAADLAGAVEALAPEARGLAGVGDQRPHALVLQGAKLVAGQAPDRRVVGAVVRERRRHDAGAPLRSTGKWQATA